MEEVIAKARALPLRSEFLLDLVKQHSTGNVLSEKQESWIRFFVWEADQRSDDVVGPKVFSVARRTGEVQTFNTELSLVEAASVCKQIQNRSEFLESLLLSYDRNKLSPKQKPWLFKIAQDEMEENGTWPKLIYAITRGGKRTEFECDWSLEKAYNILKNTTKPDDEFPQSLLTSFEKYGESMSMGRRAWLFRLALETAGEVADDPNSPCSPNDDTADENCSNIYTITRYGQAEEFKCDWPLEKAYEILQSGRAHKSEFEQSLLDNYEKHGDRISRKRKAWLFKFAMEISARLEDSEGAISATDDISESIGTDAAQSSGLHTWTVVAKGQTIKFETALSIPQAVALIRQDAQKIPFRDELVEKYTKDLRLSEKQHAWIAFFGRQLEKAAKLQSESESVEEDCNLEVVTDVSHEAYTKSESDSDWSDDDVSKS